MLVISDFSKTFTAPDMPTTWSVFAKSWILGESYSKDRDALYDEYFHFEQEGNIEKTEEWFYRHAELFAKYNLSQSQIDQIVLDDRYFSPRDGVMEYIDYIKENNISLVIVTSGISQLVLAWFEKRFHYTPDLVFGNDLVLEDKMVTGVDIDSIITPLDKKIEMELDDVSEEVILVWDSKEDLSMVAISTKTFWFTDEEIGFDISLWKGGSMKDIISHL